MNYTNDLMIALGTNIDEQYKKSPSPIGRSFNKKRSKRAKRRAKRSLIREYIKLNSYEGCQ